MEIIQIIGTVFWSAIAAMTFMAVSSHKKTLKSITKSLKQISEQKNEK